MRLSDKASLSVTYCLFDKNMGFNKHKKYQLWKTHAALFITGDQASESIIEV